MSRKTQPKAHRMTFYVYVCVVVYTLNVNFFCRRTFPINLLYYFGTNKITPSKWWLSGISRNLFYSVFAFLFYVHCTLFQFALLRWINGKLNWTDGIDVEHRWNAMHECVCQFLKMHLRVYTLHSTYDLRCRWCDLNTEDVFFFLFFFFGSVCRSIVIQYGCTL